jgi:acetyl-CoA carboxylase biotin carboxyl carrier protein
MSPAAGDPVPELDRAVEIARLLVEAIEGTSVSRLSVSAGSIRVEVERGTPQFSADGAGPPVAMAPQGADASLAASGAGATAAQPQTISAGASSDEAQVVAPLVGVFYRRPEPGKPPLVEVGDHVEVGQPLAIIEAMKMMNEVVAHIGGTISAVHASDEDVVEFNQPLFTITRAA